jgi:hypothetical protein
MILLKEIHVQTICLYLQLKIQVKPSLPSVEQNTAVKEKIKAPVAKH